MTRLDCLKNTKVACNSIFQATFIMIGQKIQKKDGALMKIVRRDDLMYNGENQLADKC